MTTASFRAAQEAQRLANEANASRRILIFANVKQAGASSVAAADKSFDDARKAEERIKLLGPKLTEARAGLAIAQKSSDDAEASTAPAWRASVADLEAQMKAAKAASSDARAHATRRQRESVLAAAILELRDQLEERGGTE